MYHTVFLEKKSTNADERWPVKIPCHAAYTFYTIIMNTKTLLSIIGVVVVVGAAVFLYKSPKGNVPGEGNGMMSQKTSLKALLAVSSPQKCTFTEKVENSESSGTVYAMHGRMRGDFTSLAAGKTINSHMIVDSDTSYVWSESAPQGMMMKFSDFDKPENKQQGATDVNKEVNYSCNAWSPDESVFVRPGDIKFMDMQGMMNQGAPGSTNAKAMQCNACNNLQEPAKTQCKAALGCQ